MRHSLALFTLAALSLAAPLHAETVEATANAARVTLFASGAAVVRLAEPDLRAGAQDLIIGGLPTDSDPTSLRIVAPEGVTLGAVRVAHGRKPPLADHLSSAAKAAKDEVTRLEQALRVKQAAVAAIRAHADAANDQLAMLRAATPGQAVTVSDLPSWLKATGDAALAAHQAVLAATAEADAADRALEGDRKALDQTRQTLAALGADPVDSDVLMLSVEASAAGKARFEITTYTDEASWAPTYDLYLTRQGGAGLAIDRGVVVAQSSGEDWQGVDLTLSTAQPGQALDTTAPWPDLRRIMSKKEYEAAQAEEQGAGGMAEPVMEPAPVVAHDRQALEVNYQGTTVTYHYPTPVDLRSDADLLRLPLGRLRMKPEVRALAVPLHDKTAVLQVEFTNDSPEILLPGQAMFYHDGALVGYGALPLIAAGAKATLGFGALDGIRLSRTEPDRMQGQEGILTSSNRLDEMATITVENLTAEEWPVRLLDSVPYSEQKDLSITYSATPPETGRDEEGHRGILRWDFTLKAGAKQEIIVKDSLGWPQDQVLQ